MAHLKLVAVLVVSGLIFIGGFAWLHPGAHPEIKNALAGELSSLNTLLLFVAMLAGCVAKALHGEVEKSRKPRAGPSFFRRALTSNSLLVSLLVSPITFLVVYKTAGVEPDRFVA